MAGFTAIALTSASLIGGGAKIIGNIKANHAQAAAERANALWYEEQAEFARPSTLREVDLYKNEAADVVSSQVSAVAKSGLTMSGSALAILADTKVKELSEVDAIKKDGAMKSREALLKAGASNAQADRLSSFWNNALPAIGDAAQTGVGIYTGLRKK